MNTHFLMCSERSGSNFITKLLNGHPDICGPAAKHVINPLARNVFRYGDLKEHDNWALLISDIYNLISLPFSKWKVSFTESDLLSLTEPGDIQGLVKGIFETEANSHGKKNILIKENQIYEFLPFILFLYPSAKFIYLVRDPRDMALSWKKNPDHSGGVIHAAKQWHYDQKNYLKNFWVLQQQGRILGLTYEDLISDTSFHVNEICEFLGVKFTTDILDFYKDSLTQENSQLNPAWKNLSKEVMKDNKNKFLSELSWEEISYIEKICMNEMQCLGYEIRTPRRTLDVLNNTVIEQYGDKELIQIPRNAGTYTKKNMEAKKIFYTRHCKIDLKENNEIL